MFIRGENQFSNHFQLELQNESTCRDNDDI